MMCFITICLIFFFLKNVESTEEILQDFGNNPHRLKPLIWFISLFHNFSKVIPPDNGFNANLSDFLSRSS